MKTKYIENYHYLECGLEYVFIKRVKAIDSPYGLATLIPKAKELDEKIAITILKHNIPFRGREIIFLRKSLGLNQTDLAKMLGLAQSTIAAWEGKYRDQKIDQSSFYFLQQFFREKFKLAIVGPTKLLKDLENQDKPFKIAV